MKSIKIVENVVTIESVLTVKQIEDALKFVPESLVLYDVTEDGKKSKNSLFVVNLQNSDYGMFSNFGISFSKKCPKNAYFNIVYPVDTNVEEALFEGFYNTISYLDKIEQQVLSALKEVDKNRKTFKSLLKGCE